MQHSPMPKGTILQFVFANNQARTAHRFATVIIPALQCRSRRKTLQRHPRTQPSLRLSCAASHHALFLKA
ncbi:hypothetical protein CEP54_010474 [Fusarium duplospermum]|uniref:Uncharacterized protein n=1 Tax=Fusarium duplospermum TaxID=1325734 RepID=A0A428PJU8_9HYPO|nr:hypothetical protein CEP54_010474 [Fusarium duplospermum]